MVDRKTSSGVIVGLTLGAPVGSGVVGAMVGLILGVVVGRLVGGDVGARVGLGEGPMGLGALDLVMVGSAVGTGPAVGRRVHPSPKTLSPSGKFWFKPPFAFGRCCEAKLFDFSCCD